MLIKRVYCLCDLVTTSSGIVFNVLFNTASDKDTNVPTYYN